MIPQGIYGEQLQIKTLGGLTIGLRTPVSAENGEGVQHLHFDARSAEAMLVYLACQGRPLAREPLAELFWPERSQEQARTNLRGSIHRLRQQLGPFVLVTRQSIGLDFDQLITVDNLEFERLCGKGRFAEAVALYQGDFLDGFYLDGSPAFEQWALMERERLRNLVISASQQLVMDASASGQLKVAIAHGERLLQLDRLHEPTHRQLMRLLAMAGRRTAALAQYAACCQMLETELGVLPDETTRALYEQIRTGALDTDQRQKSGPHQSIIYPLPSATAAPLNNLPLQSTPFIGREIELAQIGDLLANPDCRLLSLLGLGGIGKSRLALEAAQRKVADFAGGVCFVALTPVTTTDFMLAALAQSLGLQANKDDLQAQIAGALQARTLLLVLDNFEHLPDATEIVAYLLDSAPNVKFLVTARERLYLREEWLVPVAGMSVAEGVAGEAGQLFLRSAQQVRPGFTAHGQEEAIAAICRTVEGMPLALELAASWVRVMPCDEIARQITHNPELLASTVRNVPERHRNLHSLFDHSWRLLTLAEQSVFQRVSLFQGGWTLDEAAEVAGATLPLLLGLVDKSLVRTGEPGRFDLHELVRHYAARQLDASGERGLVQQRHFVAYLKLARMADNQLRGAAAIRWYTRLNADMDNIRAALQWALDSARYVDAAWMVVALSHFWSVRIRWHEVSGWLAQLLPHRHELPDDLRLAILLTACHLWRGQEEFQRIEKHMAELLQLQERSPNKTLRAVAWRTLGVAEATYTTAVAVWERCLALLVESRREPPADANFCIYADSVYQHAFALFRYAIRLTDVGEYGQAERLSSESLTLFRRLDSRDYIVFPLGNLGRLALLRGDVVQARLLFQEAVTLAASLNNTLGLLDWQPRLGIVTLYCGDAVEARRLLTESLRFCMEQKNEAYLWNSRIYTYLAELALWDGEFHAAAEWLVQAVIHHANPRWVRTELVDCLWVAARLAVAQQEYRRAVTLFGLAEQVSQHIRYVLVGPVRNLVDAALRTAREVLANEEYAEAFGAGQQLSLEEAFATILAPAHPSG